MIELDAKELLVSKVNVRGEFHGEEIETGVDIKLAGVVSNDILNAINPSLKAALFEKNRQGNLEGIGDNRTVVRFPDLAEPIKVRYSQNNMSVSLEEEGHKPLVVYPCTLHKLSFKCQDGGSCHVTFTLKCDPDEVLRGKITGLSSKQVSVTIKHQAE